MLESFQLPSYSAHELHLHFPHGLLFRLTLIKVSFLTLVYKLAGKRLFVFKFVRKVAHTKPFLSFCVSFNVIQHNMVNFDSVFMKKHFQSDLPANRLHRNTSYTRQAGALLIFLSLYILS